MTADGRGAETTPGHEVLIRRLRAAGAPPDLRPTAPEAIPGCGPLTEIGRGGQGVVYSAEQTSTRRRVAIKVIADDPYVSPERRRRFEREVEIAAGLRHPNIVPVFDSGVTESGRRYLVMDFVDGRPLDAFVEREKPAQPAVLELFAKVCDAVNHAHQRGVLHRDLKPANILVDESGEPRLLDFGLARAVEGLDAATLTVTGGITGTLAYMAPEQARGAHAEVDIRSDVFALGAVLYRLLTGRPPHDTAGDVLEALNRIASAEAPAMRALAPGVDDELETIVRRALAPLRERRYQTAGDLGADVRRYLAGEPIEAKRDSTWYVVRKALWRGRVWVGVGAVFLIVIVAAATALGVLYSRQLDLSSESERQRELAERRFDEVRTLANAVITEIDPIIRRLPGTAEARRSLVERSLAYLDALSRSAGDDLSLLVEVGAGYLTVGNALGDWSQSNLADPEAAIEQYRNALEVYERAARLAPDDFAVIMGLQQARARIGSLYRDLSREESEAELEEAIELAGRAVAMRPDDADAQRGLFSTVERLAEVLWARGERDRARKLAMRANALATRASEARPDDVWLRRDAAVGHATLGQMAADEGDLEGAIAHYRRFLEASLDLRERAPDTIVATRDVATAHRWIGMLLARQGRHEEASASFAASIAAIEQADPEKREPDMERARLSSTVKLFESLMALGRRDEAERTGATLVAEAERLARATPNHPTVMRTLGVAYYKLSELHASRAGDEALSRAARAGHARETIDALRSVLSTFLEMRERGLLSPSDEGVPGEIRSEIERWEAEAARLERPDGA